MHFNRLDLNLLVALDALLTECSVSAAAERLHLSPSATSGTLARLREYFEDDLLVQVGRRMVPTPLGETLGPAVRECLLHIQAAVETRPVFDPSKSSRRFTLMMSDYVAAILMPAVLQRLEREAPGVTIELQPNLDTPWEALERGEIDFVIVPQGIVQGSQPSMVLFEDSYVCACWTENPHVGETLTVDEFLKLGHVVAKFGRRGTPMIDEWFINNGHLRRIEVVTMSFSSVPSLLIGTKRIATLHRRLAASCAKTMPIRLVPLPMTAPPLIEVIQWNRIRDHDPGRIWLQGVLSAVASDAGA